MDWKVEFYKDVNKQILTMPPGILARFIRLLELMEKHGPNLGAPHTQSLSHGLFELRAKAKEGIGRGIFCYDNGRKVHILNAFVKKSQKTPKEILRIAKLRMKEVTSL